MARFRVSVTNASHSSGIGETIIEAPTEDEAKVTYAAVEGSTVEALAAAGLTVWSVIPA